MNDALALSILAHLTGDFLFQNSWMALSKRMDWIPAIVHGLFYGLAFVAVGLAFRSPALYSPWSLLMIISTHIVIDKLAVASYWVRVYNWDWEGDKPKTPLWVCLACDQALHTWINMLSLAYIA